MRVRCGRCRVDLDVPGPGRFSCPSCGAVNEVSAGPGMPGGPGDLGAMPPPVGGPPAGGMPPPPIDTTPSPRTTCPDCGFEFIVGDIDVAICPNCRAEVRPEGQPS